MLLLNGHPVADDALATLAMVNYGHFTTMQVRGGGVQGLAHHGRRLESATRELFGSTLDFRQVRGYMGQAVGQATDCTLRVTVFSSGFDYRRPAGRFEVDVLVSIAPPWSPGSRAARIRSCVFERTLPHIKHVGTFPLFHQRRLAMEAGRDDALFVDAQDSISEGPSWNIGFIQGGRVVWPDAPALGGTTVQLLQAALADQGVGQQVGQVRLEDLSRFEAAFACNAAGVWPIAEIDGTAFASSSQWVTSLAAALATLPRERI